ncbi:methyltransferase like 5 [Ochromonadaceae sp. CCMP2298]|nr:methyltransferase like 5 [Ochromonadaceae sp. CCMP2298]|mmetsp:Transcript_29240/g.62992  ORF Transcript_29240/g.62992 Transcript_29240/m.62992 type:complete len:204 (-) Transcript_29240:122-733(-)
MKLKELESLLSHVDPFDNPKVELEQIPTSAHIAARMLFTAARTYDDIKGCSVGDFGVGAGMLSIGCSLLGSAYTVGFEVDEEAIDNAWVNCRKMDIFDVDLVQMDVQSMQLSYDFDTVVMNPPFGTRNAGIDTAFVLKGMQYANTVYSLHKTSTRDHFVRLAQEHNFKLEVLAEVKYDIPKTFKHHKHKSKDIFVDLLRFTHI